MYLEIGAFNDFLTVTMSRKIRRFCWMSSKLHEINFVKFKTSHAPGKDNKNIYFEFTARRESDRAMAAEVRSGEENV